MRVDAYPGCRLPPFALPWAIHSLGLQPVNPLRTNRELVENKSELIENVSKVRREKRGVRSPCGVLNPDGALPLFIGGGDRLGGEGVQNPHRMAYFKL